MTGRLRCATARRSCQWILRFLGRPVAEKRDEAASDGPTSGRQDSSPSHRFSPVSGERDGEGGRG